MALFGRNREKTRAGEAPLRLVGSADLPDAEDPDLPRFRSSGRDIGSSSGLLPDARARLREAFTPAQPVQDPHMFAGRKEVLRGLIRSIEDHRMHVVLFGERGIGKTSLLHLLTRLAREADYHVAYHSCSERDGFSEMIRTIADEIPLLYDSRYDPTDEETSSGATLASLLPESNVSPGQLSEAFSHLSNTRLIVVLDEFDRSPPGEFRRNLAEFIKNLSDRSLRVQLVIAGVAGNLTELVELLPSIRRNILGIQVPPMTPAEMGDLIAIGERLSGIGFGDKAVEQIATLANGSPYLTSLLAQYAGFHAIEAGKSEVAPSHVRQAAMQVSTELRARLNERVIETVDAAIADGVGPLLLIFAKSAMETMGRVDVTDVMKHLDGSMRSTFSECLARYPDLIEPVAEGTPGRYRFTEEALPVYIWITLKQP